MTWRWVNVDGAVLHACPTKLVQLLVEEMTRRIGPAGRLISSEPITAITFDLPGMVALDRPWSKYEVDGLTIEMPDEDVATYVNILGSLEERRYYPSTTLDSTLNYPYYKLHGFHRAIVLTPTQRAALLASLRAGLPAAEASAAAFWAGRKLPSEVLREAAAHSSGQPLAEIPNLGGNKQDRFKLKKGGDA